MRNKRYLIVSLLNYNVQIVTKIMLPFFLYFKIFMENSSQAASSLPTVILVYTGTKII